MSLLINSSIQRITAVSRGVQVVQAANEAGVRRVVLVNALMPQWCPAGYMRGKLLAEQAAKDFVGMWISGACFSH